MMDLPWVLYRIQMGWIHGFPSFPCNLMILKLRDLRRKTAARCLKKKIEVSSGVWLCVLALIKLFRWYCCDKNFHLCFQTVGRG